MPSHQQRSHRRYPNICERDGLPHQFLLSISLSEIGSRSIYRCARCGHETYSHIEAYCTGEHRMSIPEPVS